MLPVPGIDNYLVLLNKASLDLVRAVEREKLRQEYIRAVAKNIKKWERIIVHLKNAWPRRQSAFYRN